ncbi:MAG: hypothetical protein CMK70_14045 [Pseudohongiella sp.]|nr:hypothetical protein [Pseudohongiella sp.]|tara:strand:+ start:3278 stop:3895 length:618 start_codon:yes stop_codon:yes gene_type:complete
MKTLAKLWQDVRSASSVALAELESAPGPKPTSQMCEFLILGEDQRIELHTGVDPFALMRSLWMTCVHRRRQGGSTIAMQLVRTLTQRYERTIWRKMSEIILAVRLTNTFNRKDITRIYLWVAYYGWNMHGFQQAFEGISKVTDIDSKIGAANLVARLKYPQPRHPNARQLGRISQRVHHLLALDSGSIKRGTFSGISTHGTISNS